MEAIIAKAVENLKQEFLEFFMQPEISIDNAETKLIEKVHEEICSMITQAYELIDREMYQDKKLRKFSGLSTERRGDVRTILSRFGEISYRRTYYQCADGTYCYPVDEVAGVEKRQRITRGVSEDLVRKALDFSYDKSRKQVTHGAVSKQTVMNKIRQSEVPKTEEKQLKPHLKALHIDADEDHVSLQNGKNVQVPVICVYEGIEKQGKRGICQNKKNYSFYGEKPEKLWQTVWDDLEKRYELTGTKIYLHGDGAAWIKAGLEYIPGSEFVLDPYHKNKAIRQLYTGVNEKERRESEPILREILEKGDEEAFETAVESVLSRTVKEANEKAGEYLLNNYEGIKRYYEDEEARSGGATEPHVSHVLSARLSSRPMGWSEKTLKKFAPILAAREFQLVTKGKKEEQAAEITTEIVKRYRKRTAPGLPDPDKAVILNASLEKESIVYKMLHYPNGRWIGAPVFPTIS